MKICLFAVLLGGCTLASAQLDVGGILGGGNAGGTVAGSRVANGGGRGMGLDTMLMSSMAANDLSALPAMVMMNRNPSMMRDPMGALVMSNAFGIDVHKIAAPMAMLSMGGSGGARQFMPWMPLMSGDPSTLGMALSMGGGMMNPLSFLAMANM